MPSGSMIWTLTTRLSSALVTLWLVTILFFIVTELMPGDFATATAGRDTTREMIEATRHELGLFASAPERYLSWLTGLMTGDLGTSWWRREPIAPVLAEHAWHSAWLVVWSIALTVPLALIIAIIAVRWRGGLFDRAASVTALTTMSFPDFLIAYGLMTVLAVHLDLVPVHTVYVFEMPVLTRLQASVLPILSLAMVTVTPMFRLTRAALIGVMASEFVQMAELKGMSRWRVLLVHALPNAVAPIATAIVMALANLFFGLVIIESIFSYPGLGQLLIKAVQSRDVPLVQACALVTAVLFIGMNFLADAAGILTNPRLRYPVSPLQLASIPQSLWTWAQPKLPALATAGAIVLAIFVAWQAEFIPHHKAGETWSTVAPPPAGPRRKLAADLLLADRTASPELIHYDHFKPWAGAGAAKHGFEGTLTVPAFKAHRRLARNQRYVGQARFPGFTARFFRHGDVLLPLNAARILPATDGWRIMLSPGRVWHEPADGDAWSRAAFAFTLAHESTGAGHYGVATFLYNGETTSQIFVQVAQETANWNQFDFWGQSAMAYQPEKLADADEARREYKLRQATRLTIRPWAELAAGHWRSLEGFDGRGNRENISVSGLMVDDVFYLRPCRTRAGPHPYCRHMRHSVFSITKTVGAGIAMLWLAKNYGVEVFNEKITDHVTIPARHRGWMNVTFADALNMTTGVGNGMPYRVDQYVEVDFSPIANRIWRARSTADKLEAMALFNNYPWGPGEVFRYRTSDTTLLAAAMEAYLRKQRGPDTDLWGELTREVFVPLGIPHLPVRRTREADGRLGTPLLGAGLYLTIEEALKLARLFRDHGEHNGKQLLHRGLTARAVSTANYDRGIETFWRDRQGGRGRYDMSFWLTPHPKGWFGCKQRIPGMAGFGGNYLFVMPNNTIALRFSDGHDDDPHTWDSYGIRRISDRIRPFCG